MLRMQAEKAENAQAVLGDPPIGIADEANSHRYCAACYAALAGTGQGEDAVKLDAKEQTRLRKQALDWLRADYWQRYLFHPDTELAGLLR